MEEKQTKKSLSSADKMVLMQAARGDCYCPTCTEPIIVYRDDRPIVNCEFAHIRDELPPKDSNSDIGWRYWPSEDLTSEERNSFENLILLCSPCHKLIDKIAPRDYSVELLHQWKAEHESRRELGKEVVFDSRSDLWTPIRRLLMENRILWRDLGPQSHAANTDPGSNLYEQWNFRKLNTIIPNNTRIVNHIESNSKFLADEEFEVFLLFKAHAYAFESNQYNRLDSYPRFPSEFARIFEQ
jgi:HNH endonuclease